MKAGIRQKLWLGLGGMMVIVATISVLTIRQIDELGASLAIVLKQNYLSVEACQDMKDALESIDRGVLQSFDERHHERPQMANISKAKFLDALERERRNITLPGERELVLRLQELSGRYFAVLDGVMDGSLSKMERRERYAATLEPLSNGIRGLTQRILDMNESNMISQKHAALDLSVSARWRVLIISLTSIVVAMLLSQQIHRWVLKPLRYLIASTDEIRRGSLDVVLQTGRRDEIGQLSRSFNEMLVALRQSRNSDMIRLTRSRKATEEVFRALPMPVAVLDTSCRVEFSTSMASGIFGLKPGVAVGEIQYPWMGELAEKSMTEMKCVTLPDKGFIQEFVGNQERFFRPEAVPIISVADPLEVAGSILMILDVTQLHEHQEMKRGLVSTVSHQLRTPLTSLRMSVHLLLDDAVGTLNVQQADLLVGAREDCERLVEILDDLLELKRIESGNGALELLPAASSALVHEGVAPFANDARDKKVTLKEAVAAGLPDVVADAAGIRQVFANLLSNALRFTLPGGSVTAGALREGEYLRFFVEDTGTGIDPEHMEHLFEPFYRVPGQDSRSGAGLGLSIVRELVEAQGGSVAARSQPGQGSVFSFTLPVYRHEEPQRAGTMA
ncbi:MAG: HAMP domain-containing protein [Chlorobiaceae bacterium]|nr:HAMP domain-containing protein [Chlorobiaceae bacterium]